jgi:predicted transcriptional regulator
MAEQTSGKNHADGQLLRMTADVVAAYVKHNSITSTQLPAFIGSVYASLRALDELMEGVVCRDAGATGLAATVLWDPSPERE